MSAKWKMSRVALITNQLNECWEGLKHDSSNGEQLLSTVEKLHQLLLAREKSCQDLITKRNFIIPIILEILKYSIDENLHLCQNILSIVNHLMSLGKQYIQCFMVHGVFTFVCDCLTTTAICLVKEPLPLLEYNFILTLQITLKLSSKDKHCNGVIRLSGALVAALDVLKTYPNNHKLLQSILPVLKSSCTASSVNSNVVIKSDVISLLAKILPTCGSKKVNLLKGCVELLCILCKQKNGARGGLEVDLLRILIILYQEWELIDQKNRHINLRKAILTNIKVLVTHSFAKKYFLDMNGYKTLYLLAKENIEKGEYENLFQVLVAILRKCARVTKLPLKNGKLLTFDLPVVSTTSFMTSSSTENDDINVHDEYTMKVFDGESSSSKDLDEKPSSYSSEKYEKLASDENADDIEIFKEFFKELDSDDFDSRQPVAFYIPTGGSCCHDDDCVTNLSISDLERAIYKTSLTDIKEKLDEIDDGSKTHEEPLMNDYETEKRCSESENESDKRFFPSTTQSRDMIRKMESQTCHVLPFIKTPDHMFFEEACIKSKQQPLYFRKPDDTRLLILNDLARNLYPNDCVNRVVYGLDVLLDQSNLTTDHLHANIYPSPSPKKSPLKKKSLGNNGASRCRSTSELQDEILKTQPLQFESRFECGNLRKAIQIRQYEYDLILNPDVNCSHHHQWFYFQVTNMQDGIPYRFNIINCEKISSQFNFGMQPVLFSLKNAMSGTALWERVGVNIAYYRNVYLRPTTMQRNYFTATFTIIFPHKKDTCYLAYHFPYSYTMLKLHLSRWEASLSSFIYYQRQVLCKSLSNNEVDLITITSKISSPGRRFCDKPFILLTARVHPGESNSSWVMKGVIEFLLSNDDVARKLRGLYIFKIIPMLNPDGVINGCHRCSLSGHDLNRQWLQPDKHLHSPIYHAKSLIKYMTHIGKRPLLFVDFHGHSRRKNIFMYGCKNTDKKPSVIGLPLGNVTDVKDDDPIQAFPKILDVTSSLFALKQCSFAIEKNKESTARVVGFKEFDIQRSYTMENTYCGFDQGPLKGMQVRIEDLLLMGEHFCQALLRATFTSNVIREVFQDG